ncbi:restriction endonuclease subunit S [Streptomyces durocortorensis]|uniref:Restriction endonuclease subunit S n=1 Tax=Streptomyces durocortorensis TaxID=2811104 RepID=A0ABS2HYI0_9ACTN|nr:restriction endonuclease subunit S [Streptomyces durocortorensis]MBM7054959.1 restriction endonuclease subunit S [Streptomyces durocortorensis]
MREFPLGEVLETLIDHRGKTPKKLGGEFTDEGVPVVSALLVKSGKRIPLVEARRVPFALYEKWMPNSTQKNDVILTSEAPLGQCALIETNDPLCLGQRVFGLRGRRGVLDGRFLYYSLQSSYMQGQLNARASGTTVLGIRQTELLRAQIRLPQISDQRAVAEVLGALDDKTAFNERLCATGLDLGDAFYRVAVQQEGSARHATLGQLMAEGSLRFGDGYRTKAAEHGTPGLPILRVAEVGDGTIAPSFGDHVREEFRSAMRQKTSRAGDVVLTTKGTVGRVAMISPHDAEFVYSPQVCFFRPVGDAPFSAPYLFHWLRGQDFWRQAAGMKGQTDMADYLSLSDIRSLRISLPTESALAAFDRRCAPLHARAEAARLENRTLADLRDTLLPQLVTGKLRVKDAVRVVEEAV